jgi:alkylated DNA repair dioxygenase AlkB
MNATTAADQAANELTKIIGDLDIRQKQLLKDWIYQGIHAGTALFESVTDIVKIKALMKAATKGAKEVMSKRRTNHGKEGWSEEWVREIFKE